MWMLVLGAALAANKWEGQNADVEAVREIAAPPEAIYPLLLDLETIADITPPVCASKWHFGEVTSGVGASAQVVYHAASMHRKLTATIAKVSENRQVSVDHPGNKGFVTTWTLTATEAGTSVDLHTYLNQPPFPFRGYYFRRVQPSWERCHESTLENLGTRVTAR